jgi:hypothetical protein
VAHEQKKAIISAVTCHMTPDAWHACKLSKKAVMPAIRNLRLACKGSLKCGWSSMSKKRKLAVYADCSGKTVMERADGMMPALEVQSSQGRSGLLTVTAGAALFQAEVMTSALGDKTRQRYHALWQGFVTYGLAQRNLPGVLPASTEMVQAWALQLLMLGASPSLIRASIAAVQSRHSEYGFLAPLREPRLFQRIMRAVFSLQGSPRRQITPISRSLMRRMMRLENLTASEKRDVALTVAGTQMCARVGEIKRLQACDFLKDYDVSYSRRYRGSAALRIRKRKQDRERKGLYPRLFKGTKRSLCIVRRLEAMM